MTKVSVRDLRNRFATIRRLVESEGEVIVTDNATPTYPPVFGCRSLDALHVANALELECKRFLTFDLRQRRLARAAGLKLVILAS